MMSIPEGCQHIHTLASLRDAKNVSFRIPVLRLRRPPANRCEPFGFGT